VGGGGGGTERGQRLMSGRECERDGVRSRRDDGIVWWEVGDDVMLTCVLKGLLREGKGCTSLLIKSVLL